MLLLLPQLLILQWMGGGGTHDQFLLSPCVCIPPPLFLIKSLVLAPVPLFFFCFSFCAFLCSLSSFCFFLCLFSSDFSDLLFLIGIHSIQDWITTTRHGVTKKMTHKKIKAYRKSLYKQLTVSRCLLLVGA